MNTAETADLVRGVIVATIEMVAEVLKSAPDSLAANQVGDAFSDPALVRELQGTLVAGLDQFVAGWDRE